MEPKPLTYIFDLFKKEEKPVNIKNIFGDPFKSNNIERLINKSFGFNLEEKVLKYEGEYLNGKRHGKGKEFTKNKILVYEGEYKNGLLYGKGKQYDDLFSKGREPKLKYEGEFKCGKWDGKGKEYETGFLYVGDRRLKHEGNFVKGKFVS